MKRVRKGAEPVTLTAFRTAHPEGTWKDVRSDRQLYDDCRNQVIGDQKTLCAYCEAKIDPIQLPRHCKVEHFHPKSDISTDHNWHLDWQNMLGTCVGGELEPDKVLHPLPDNLSCDAHKNHVQLTCDVEETVINPLDLPAFPNVFIFDESSGHLWPDASACQEAGVNACTLLRTIHILNLNCNRLARARLNVFDDIEEMIDDLQNEPFNDRERMDMVLAYCFTGEDWPEYFTTYRCCLGQAAEKYLQSNNYNG